MLCFKSVLRAAMAMCALAVLTACTKPVIEDNPAPIGAFSMGHNIVVAPKVTKSPVSRTATKDELIGALTLAIDERFARFDGPQTYHFGTSIEGYALAPPGVPVLLAPKSVFVFQVTVWDEQTGEKLNDEPHRMTAFESFDGNSIIGSGLTRTKEEQLATLTFNAARMLEDWLRTKPEWFVDATIEPDPVN